MDPRNKPGDDECGRFGNNDARNLWGRGLFSLVLVVFLPFSPGWEKVAA